MLLSHTTLRRGLILVLLGALSHSTVFAQCEQKIRSMDIQPADEFGSTIRVSGNTAFVGAYEHDLVTQDGGAVYVYELQGKSWVETEKLIPQDNQVGDWFGFGIALDGDRALISSFAWSGEQGRVYVFERTSSGWMETAQLIANDGQPGDWFGISLALEGDVAIVGAPHDDDQSTDSGSLYVFENTSGQWQETSKLTASDPSTVGRYGFSVAISEGVVISGSYRHAHNGIRCGAAYIIEKLGGTWTQTAELLAADNDRDDHFGISVDIDHGTVLIGARQDDEARINAGAAYLFKRLQGLWVQVAKIAPRVAQRDQEFGNKVSLNGSRALVGAYQTYQLQGRAYLFEEHSGVWTERFIYKAFDRRAGDLFGHDTALSENFALVGAFLSGGDRSGAMYAFTTEDLGLEALPSDVASGDTLTFDGCGGDPSNPLILVLTSLNGNPTFDLITGLETFEQDGSWHTSFTVPSGLGTMDFEFRLFSINPSNDIVTSITANVHHR